MQIIKPIAAYLWTQIRRELTIQKPKWVPEPVSVRKARHADAAKGILLLIIAPVIFFILALVIGF